MKGEKIYRKLFMIAILTLIITGAAYGVDKELEIPQDSVTVTADNLQLEEMSPVAEYMEWILYRLSKIPLILVILYAITILSIITMLILLVFILLNRSKIEREAKLREFLLEEYQRLMMDYLFDDGNREKTFQEIVKIANNKLKRQILIDQIIDIMVNLKGKIKENAKNLYLELGLKKDSMRKTRSRKWHKKIKGYRELAFMNIRSANESIFQSLNSKNEILRMEAQIALVRLSDENPFDWMDRLDKPLSRWEQITLLELLVQHNLNIPEFKQWCYSENLSVVIFTLEMIGRFEQKDAENEIVSLFEHENEKIRRTAYRISGDLKFRTALPPMKTRYHQETFDNRMEILKSFQKTPDESNLDFLKGVLDLEDDVQLQIQATKAISKTDEPGVSMLVKLLKSKSEYKNYQIIIKHVLDGRIN